MLSLCKRRFNAAPMACLTHVPTGLPKYSLCRVSVKVRAGFVLDTVLAVWARMFTSQ